MKIPITQSKEWQKLQDELGELSPKDEEIKKLKEQVEKLNIKESIKEKLYYEYKDEKIVWLVPSNSIVPFNLYELRLLTISGNCSTLF